MEVELLDSPQALARVAAAFVAARARASVRARGVFLLATSGGSSPRPMFEALADEDVPWDRVHCFQVDERVVRADSPQRNLRMLREALLERIPLPVGQLHPMPVDDLDLRAAAQRYAATLRRFAEAGLDLVHLGLGADGHTASLVPDDPVLEVFDRDVAVTGPYQGHRRMTLTYPILRRAREVLWLVTGEDKRDALHKLVDADASIPAGRVGATLSTLFTDVRV